MQILNFYQSPSSLLLVGKMASEIKPGMTDKEFLEHEIKIWLNSKERQNQILGEAYYNGKHNILSRKRMVVDGKGNLKEEKKLPNNKIVDNEYANQVDKKTNYLCGKPFTIDAKNKDFANALNKVFNKKMRKTIRRVVKKSIVSGKVWLYVFYDEKGELSFSLYPAHRILPLWKDAEHTDLDCAVHMYPVYTYNENGEEEIIFKADVIHGGGIDRFIWDSGELVFDNQVKGGAFVNLTDKETGEIKGFNWERCPLICFRSNEEEIPLICRVKCLQDALNLILSNFVNCMSEDIHSTIIVIKNYDGENLGELRQNLAEYAAIKVSDEGGVETLKIEVNAENYKLIISLLKKAIIENAKGYDGKDERMSGNPNQMNIQSMYSDIDLDANGMDIEFQSSFEELGWFIKTHLANTGLGNFENEDFSIIFNRDILINETEVIDNLVKQGVRVSNETLIKQHPYVENAEEELERVKKESESIAYQDPLRMAFESTSHKTVEE